VSAVGAPGPVSRPISSVLTPGITSDTLGDMADVTIRELRNSGGEVVDRAAQGEAITITRAGQPVARLTAVRAALSGAVLIERWKRLPTVDPAMLRADVDEAVDPSLFPEE